jgi:hypothetical protein
VRRFERDGDFGRAGLRFESPAPAALASIRELITELAVSYGTGQKRAMPQEAEELLEVEEAEEV